MTPRRPRRRAGQRRDFRKLTGQEEDSLTHGFHYLADPEGHAFETEEDARTAWELHADRIMAEWDTPFRRPRGWWLFEHNGPVPSTGRAQIERLEELDALTNAERRMLRQWDRVA